MQLLRLESLALRIRPDTGIHQFAVKALGLVRRLEENGILGHPRGPKIIGEAADGDDENVIGNRRPCRDLFPVFIDMRPDRDLSALAAKSGHFADSEAES